MSTVYFTVLCGPPTLEGTIGILYPITLEYVDVRDWYPTPKLEQILVVYERSCLVHN